MYQKGTQKSGNSPLVKAPEEGQIQSIISKNSKNSSENDYLITGKGKATYYAFQKKHRKVKRKNSADRARDIVEA